MKSTHSFHILVTDKNHHVRDLLARELDREGHVTYNVDSGTSTYNHILGGIRLDLIILDPEIFGPGHLDLFHRIVNDLPAITIILHTFSDLIHLPKKKNNIVFIAKGTESIQTIKQTITAMLLEPERNSPV